MNKKSIKSNEDFWFKIENEEWVNGGVKIEDIKWVSIEDEDWLSPSQSNQSSQSSPLG